MTHEDNHNNTILGVLALCFKVAGLFTIGQFLNGTLTTLSILSVSMLMVINWDKFILRIKKIRIKRRKRK